MPAFILEQQSGSNSLESGPKLRRANTNSTRFLAKNFIENEMSSRSNVTISSTTVSSPGYFSIKDEIDPSTYSFTTALKALQGRSVYSWEYISADGIILNSKWNDAEKYICNPLSGQVPLECLSAKTLSSRSFSSRITVSAHPKSPIIQLHNHEKKKIETRDVGIQSTPVEDVSTESSSYSTLCTTEERSRKESEGDSSAAASTGILKPQPQVEERETKDRKRKEGIERKKVMWRCEGEGGRGRGCGLVALKGLWQRDKCKPRGNKNPTSSPTFHYTNYTNLDPCNCLDPTQTGHI
ncbi:hypothetical protein ACS0TY_029037 [Phlomoides rotata]